MNLFSLPFRKMLAEAGLHGNSHFPMSDLNNVQVADHLEKFLVQAGLAIQ
jgi:peptidoglycan/xylan/chitin deacetylase (PgdA/CDA1 family)